MILKIVIVSKKVLILGYGVHKIRENEFKSIVTLTRCFWCLQ